ncbi:MAG: methylated-DNA--[protein]-cysteine S-methyltransferase [Anaerolineae bacterium]
MAESNILFTDTPLGLMWLWATERGLCGVGFGETVGHGVLNKMARGGIALPRPVRSSLLETAKAQLLAYFNWRRDTFDLPLDLRGTDFQLAVWERLQGVPYGETTTYGDIALLLGSPHASQAVGQAIGANPTAIVVPCHRVLGADGSLTGYAGGVERKAALLALEQAGLQLRMPFTGGMRA